MDAGPARFPSPAGEGGTEGPTRQTWPPLGAGTADRLELSSYDRSCRLRTAPWARARLRRSRLRPGARPRAGRLLRRVLLDGAGAVSRLVLPADVRDHRGLPPLLQPSHVPPGARAAVPARVS